MSGSGEGTNSVSTGTDERATDGRPGDEHPTGPTFFLSYAHTPKSEFAVAEADGGRRYATVFFRDLCAHLRELLGCKAGEEPGFMDEAMEGGERWDGELRKMLGTCQVFVPLLSPRYGRSKWCEREWRAFECRTVQPTRSRRGGPRSAIVPVLWMPEPVENLPKWVQTVQVFTPNHLHEQDAAACYWQDGVYGLRATNHDAYEIITWRIVFERWSSPRITCEMRMK